ncbi:10537_t:CDS:1, partial [Racocetra persica]
EQLAQIQQIILTVLQASKLKKNNIILLVKAFVEASISFKKIDKLYNQIKENFYKGGTVLSANNLCQNYLSE